MGRDRKCFTSLNCSTARLPESAFPDQITAALRTHFRRVHCICGDIAAFSLMISRCFPRYGEGHFTAQNNMRRLLRMRVIGIERIGVILPDVCAGKTFLIQLKRE